MSEATLTEDFIDLQKRFELDVYGKRGIALVRGRGTRVWDDSGREYLDAVAGHGAVILGHGHSRVLAAINDQAERLISCPGAFYNNVRAAYLQELMDAAPPGLTRAFLCNSGTEAVEGALKFARIATGRPGIVAARGGFHGRTFGAMTATFNPKYSQACKPLVPGFTHVPFNDAEAMREAVGEGTAAVILEPIQGEGGVRLGDADYFAEVRRICDRAGALLILDEVQTGFGRTGTLFACQGLGVRPDIMCLAKGMANGLPAGAILVAENVPVAIGQHGSTFGGNPLVCAAALAVLRELRRAKLAPTAAEKGEALTAPMRSADLPVVREIRQAGLMIGIELKTRVHPVLQQLMAAGVLALPAGATVLRLLPPLTIGADEIAAISTAILDVLAAATPGRG